MRPEICCNVQRPRETDRRTAKRESSTSREKTATLKKSSISFFRIVGAMFMQLRARCAHHSMAARGKWRFLDIPSTRSYPSVLGMMSKTKKPDALQGTLDLLVLKTLSREPRHGYSVAARIQEITDDALRVEEGSLYPALHRMEQAGWITAEWRITENNRRARIYRLTRAGQKRLGEEEARWDRLAEGVGKVLRFA